MKRILFFCIVAASLFSCGRGKTFSVEGVVNNAEGKMLYLDYVGLLKTAAVDSVKIRKGGSFKFTKPAPQYPDFYSLRMDNKTIIFAVDSTETIRIEAGFDNFSAAYTVTGSESSVRIQELRKSVFDIQRKINALKPDMAISEQRKKAAEIEQDIETHKAKAREIIIANPASAEAYFAVYQQINNRFVFSPYVKEDKPYVNAVATAYHSFMPGYVRSKNLYNLAMDAIKTEREEKNRQAWSELVETSGKGYIDVALPGKDGKERKLSALEGKTVLIDFSSYEMDKSVQYTFELRELYNKYNKKGFEIYQISLDRNKILWEASVENIPWVCVRDENGVNTPVVGWYNVTSIPTIFLMDKKGDIVLRSLSFNELDKKIQEVL
ncbi:MAG: DUF4369 domain-containing protein [Prevotellaceae bacterium]|jgi:peroxiredoxin|nr:DUF4369 domain-containing protein [Prevotellaceae bacterium]